MIKSLQQVTYKQVSDKCADLSWTSYGHVPDVFYLQLVENQWRNYESRGEATASGRLAQGGRLEPTNNIFLNLKRQK